MAKKMLIHMETYESVGQMANVLLHRESNVVMKGRNESESNDKRFTMTESLEEALDLLNNGWNDKVEEIKKSVAKLNKVNASVANRTKIRPTNSVVGYVPNVPNAIIGLPESMINQERIKQKVKAVRIVHALGVNGGEDANTILKAGIAVLQLVNLLEAKGIRVRLDCQAIATSKGNEYAVCNVKVKDWRQPLDLRKVAFPIAHPSFLRRIGFRFIETVPGLTSKDFRYGYGTPLSNNGYEEEREKNIKIGAISGDNEFFTSVRLCEQCGYDIHKIAKRAGIAL